MELVVYPPIESALIERIVVAGRMQVVIASMPSTNGVAMRHAGPRDAT